MEELNRDDMKEHLTYLKMYKEVIKDGIISHREAKQLEAQRDKIKGPKR